MPVDSGRYPSGQRGQTVNLLANAFGGSNPPLPTILMREGCERHGFAGALRAGGGLGAISGPPCQSIRGNSSAVERQPSKLGVAGSNPVSRSRFAGHVGTGVKDNSAHVAQMAERVLGKDEVSGSIPDMGSTGFRVAGRRGGDLRGTVNGR